MNIGELRRLKSDGTRVLRITSHGKIESRKDGLTEDDLEHAFWNGEVIEDYGFRALLLDFTVSDALPIHIVVEDAPGRQEIVIVSAYVPDASIWEKDCKTRRRGDNR